MGNSANLPSRLGRPFDRLRYEGASIALDPQLLPLSGSLCTTQFEPSAWLGVAKVS